MSSVRLRAMFESLSWFVPKLVKRVSSVGSVSDSELCCSVHGLLHDIIKNLQFFSLRRFSTAKFVSNSGFKKYSRTKEVSKHQRQEFLLPQS